MATFHLENVLQRMRNTGLEFRTRGKAAANDATVPRPRAGDHRHQGTPPKCMTATVSHADRMWIDVSRT